jgi:hypothetical protein
VELSLAPSQDELMSPDVTMIGSLVQPVTQFHQVLFADIVERLVI